LGKKTSSLEVKLGLLLFPQGILMSFSPTELITIFPQELLPYTQEGKNKISRLVNSNKIYVLFIVMFE